MTALPVSFSESKRGSGFIALVMLFFSAIFKAAHEVVNLKLADRAFWKFQQETGVHARDEFFTFPP